MQPARLRAPETMDEFVKRRQREEARRDIAYAAGHGAWAASTRSDQSLSAPRTTDVVALGARELETHRPRANARHEATSPLEEGGTRYGQLYAPPKDVAELRRQQAAFARVTREIDKQNRWMAIPALAPAAAVLGLEAAGAIAARFAVPTLQRAPLVLEERMPYLRVGDNWATRAGRRAHEALKARVQAKPGWDAEQAVRTPNGLRRPDVRAPARSTDPNKRLQMELKPDTPSGRRAAARAVKNYIQETGNRTRGIFYNPKDFM